MNSQLTLGDKEASSAYYDKSFESQNRQGSSRPADIPADWSPGHNFTPFYVEDRDFHIIYLLQTRPELFQLFFILVSLVYTGIEYIDSWVAYLLENGVTNRCDNPISPSSGIPAAGPRR
jgi:hypothetical protein